MKTLHTLLTGVLLFSLTSCEKMDIGTPAPTVKPCKLVALDRGNGIYHQYDYNAAGNVSKAILSVAGIDKPDERYEYSFSYNSKNQITGATITLNGKTPTEATERGIGSSLTFTWTNDQLTQMVEKVGSKTLLTTAIRYDAQGRIVRMQSAAAADFGASFEKTFTYEADGRIKYLYLEEGEKNYYEEQTIDSQTRSSESLLGQHGLPFDVFNLQPWHTHSPTVLACFEFDKTGKMVPYKTYRVTEVVKNHQNIAISETIESGGQKRTSQFTLNDCD